MLRNLQRGDKRSGRNRKELARTLPDSDAWGRMSLNHAHLVLWNALPPIEHAAIHRNVAKLSHRFLTNDATDAGLLHTGWLRTPT